MPPPKPTQEEKGFSARLWDLISKIASAGLLALAGYVVSLENRISTIEATHWTTLEAAKQSEELKDWMDSRYPPPWLREDLGEIKLLLKNLEERVRLVELKVGD